jgi:hypothetical protein
MESMDDLLAQMKAEYEQKHLKKSPESSENVKPQSPIPAVMNNSNFSSSPLDNLLAEVKAELEKPPENKSQKSQTNASVNYANSSATENLLKQVKEDLEKPISMTRQPLKSFKNNISQEESPLVKELKNEFEEKKKEEKIRQEQELIEAKKQEEIRLKRKREGLRKKAEEWLKKLDPNTDEGLWFEEFSYAYESKVDAAIDYLEALRETRF